MSETTALAPVVPMDVDVFERAEAIASKLAKSALLPAPVRGKTADLAVIMLTGHELGLSPMQSLRGLHVVEGRPVLAAGLIVGLVKKHPLCKYFRLVESTDERAVYETLRVGEPGLTRLAWTIQQARNAGLAGRQNWKAHPAAMLRARCSAALARAVYPDVAMGICDPDEAEDIRQGVVIEAQTVAPPEPPPVAAEQPKRQSKTKAQPAPAAPEEPEDAVYVEPEEWQPPSDADAPPPSGEPDEDPVQVWTERISGTPDLEALGHVRNLLVKEHPSKDDPVRIALRDVYASRERELRRAEQ